MAHIKKRQNTTIRAFKFGARPFRELPQAFWDIAKQMQFVWNELVTMRENTWEKVKNLEKKDRIPLYQEFEKDWRGFMKSENIKNLLGNDEREFIQEKFEYADKKAKKNKGSLKKRYSLDRILFRHRFTSGGKPIADFKKQNTRGFSFLFPAEKHYQSNEMSSRKKRIGSGVFGVVKDRQQIFSFPFSAVIHREIPENAIIKSVIWTGRRLKNSGYTKKDLPENQRDWRWSVVVTAEVPQPDEHKFQAGRIVALDVGWRKLNDSFLRVGALQDSGGNKIEVRCPIAYESNNVRHGKLISGLIELSLLDEQIDKLIESVKRKLAEVGVKNLTKMREGGLFRLARQLSESGENPTALEIIENFKKDYYPLSSIRIRSQTRLQNYRDWVYRNVAAWLADNYDALVWEGDLNLKKIAETKKNLTEIKSQKEIETEKARRHSAKYRNFASIHSFREKIKKAFDKKGKTVFDGVTAYSSRKCSECGEIVEKFIDAEFICSNGHNLDRDFNATKNLLNQYKNDFVFAASESLQIPNQPNRNLSRILVEIKG